MRVRLALALALLTALAPARVRAASAVFDGDPTDAGTGLPFEILPGQPLVGPGPDGRIGTADDTVDRGRVGDIDLVVRLGSVPAGVIPAPAAARGAVATAIAGPPGTGTPIPFRVYLSDGMLAPERPYGGLLAAADMEGLPVVVTAFADLNGDGVIGPAAANPVRQVQALRELEPVGRAVAPFRGGVASGAIAVLAGAPAGRGGLRVVATAMALTGPYDAGFLEGHVPAGPLITTAQPFLPERDPARVFSQDLGPLEDGGTLNPSPRAAGIPDPAGLDLSLPVDGSSPTVDTARAVAGSAVCARLVESAPGVVPVPAAPAELVLASGGTQSRRRLRLVAVDRLGNPTTPEGRLAVEVVADGPLALLPDRDGTPAVEPIAVMRGRRPGVALRATGPGVGTLRVLLGGAVCQRLTVEVQAERMAADARVSPVGRADYRTVGEAVAAATDRNGDGRIVVVVAAGVYRESVRVTRPVELFGAGEGRTVIDAAGRGAALALAHAGAGASDLTASGGTVGVGLEAAVSVRRIEARANVGAGIRLAADGAAAVACAARENGAAGMTVDRTGLVDGCISEGNAGAGVAVRAAAAVAVIDSTSIANGGDGIDVSDALAPVLRANSCAGNLGTGITVAGTTGGTLIGNRASGNDDNGLRLNQSDGALIDGNDLSANGGYGLRIDRSTADFAAAAGEQAPPGSNDVRDNRKGALLFD